MVYKTHDGLARVIDEWLDLIQREEFSSYYGSHRLFGRIDTIIWNLKIFVKPQQILPADAGKYPNTIASDPIDTNSSAAFPRPDVANKTIKFYFGGVNIPNTFSKNLWNSDTVKSARFVDDGGKRAKLLARKTSVNHFQISFRLCCWRNGDSSRRAKTMSQTGATDIILLAVDSLMDLTPMDCELAQYVYVILLGVG